MQLLKSLSGIGIMTTLLRLSMSFRVSRGFSSRCRPTRRLSSAAVLQASSGGGSDEEEEDGLLHPDQFGEIPHLKSLSPSSILEFKKCPQSFMFQYLYKIKQPTSTALAKGSMCHDALEKLFDLESEDRTLENLHNLLRASWSQHRLGDQYGFLFDDDNGQRDIAAERAWGQSALALLDNYYMAEDPRTITRPNPMKREFWLHSNLTVDPSLGVTAGRSKKGQRASGKPETMYIRGIVDRLDMVKTASKEVALKIVDYKTGKAPDLKYSRSMNEKIVEENFYQLKIYALLLREKGAGADQFQGLDFRYLRLFYLTSHAGDAKPWEYDLGETQEQRDEVLQDIHQDITNVWTSVRRLVDLQDPKAFEGCDRSFCYCHRCRPRFVPGSVWEP
jgi:RecB family exonuclease